MLNCNWHAFQIATSTAGETECQDQEEGEFIETEAEQDELLMECAGEVLVSLGNVITPEDFMLFFQRVLPLLLQILVFIFFFFYTSYLNIFLD